MKLQLPVAHIEAGLRSFDEAMPEEHNRRLTDHLSAVLLAHSESAIENLEREGIDADRSHLVGNTMIDSLLAQPRAGARRAAVGALRARRGRLRARDAAPPEPRRPARAARARRAERLAELAREQPLVFPVHPRTLARLDELGLRDALAARRRRARAAARLPRLPRARSRQRRFVLTDSGGVQEETSALGVRCFTLRDSTERPVTVELGTNTVLGADPAAIALVPALLAESRTPRKIPLWDGSAGRRAAEVLLRQL